MDNLLEVNGKGSKNFYYFYVDKMKLIWYSSGVGSNLPYKIFNHI